MAPKISNFIISLALISFIVGGIGVFVGTLSNNYGVNYDNSTLDEYNNINTIYNQTKEIEDEATSIDPNSNPLQEIVNIIDGFFTGAYNTLILAWKSFNIFSSVADQTSEHIGENEITKQFKTTMIIIMMIILLIGVIVSAIVKREM